MAGKMGGNCRGKAVWQFERPLWRKKTLLTSLIMQFLCKKIYNAFNPMKLPKNKARFGSLLNSSDDCKICLLGGKVNIGSYYLLFIIYVTVR